MGLDRLGVGLGYRPELRDDIKAHLEEIDFVEVISESCFRPGEADHLAAVSRSLPVLCHGLHLSVGTAAPVDEGYLAELRRMRDTVRPTWLSDHLALSRIGQVELGHLAPLEFTSGTVELVCDKVRPLTRKAGPFLLENITYYFALPGAEMMEAEFISAVAEGADCGLLLDLNNLFVNAQNHGYDPYTFLDQIPLDRVVEVHLAGGRKRGELWVDTHGEAVRDEVWNYLTYVCARTDVSAVLIERDQNFGPFDDLISELRHARSILTGSFHGER